MTRFIIHIGPHKTGTTYLQETLAAHRDQLLRHGIVVPSVWDATPQIPSHMQLVWALRNHDHARLEQQITGLLRQRPRCVVISCEALSRLDPPLIIRLRQLLGTAQAEIIYYVRRWSERLLSLWQETVKFGHSEVLPEYLARHLTDYECSELRDAPMVDKFAAVFGADRIRLVAYSQLTDAGIDIAAHFFESFLGLPAPQLPATVIRPNQSLPVLDIELIRALNAIHLSQGGERSPALRNWFLGKGRALATDGLRQAMTAHVVAMRIDEAIPWFAGEYRDLRGRYGASVVPPSSPSGLHTNGWSVASYVRPDYLLEPATIARLRDIYRDYRGAF